jgi:hypothetical protein
MEAKLSGRSRIFKKGEDHIRMQTLSAILGANFGDLQYLFHFEKPCCKGVCVCVCVSKSATEIVHFKLLALRIAMLLNNLVKHMPHCSDFKDGGHFEYFTSINRYFVIAAFLVTIPRSILNF